MSRVSSVPSSGVVAVTTSDQSEQLVVHRDPADHEVTATAAQVQARGQVTVQRLDSRPARLGGFHGTKQGVGDRLARGLRPATARSDDDLVAGTVADGSEVDDPADDHRAPEQQVHRVERSRVHAAAVAAGDEGRGRRTQGPLALSGESDRLHQQPHPDQDKQHQQDHADDEHSEVLRVAAHGLQADGQRREQEHRTEQHEPDHGDAGLLARRRRIGHRAHRRVQRGSRRPTPRRTATPHGPTPAPGPATGRR